MPEIPENDLMHAVDWCILACYLLILTAIGIYFSRKTTSFDEFVRGKQDVGWLAVGTSLIAALNSGIDFVQTPALVFAFGLIYASQLVSWIFLYPWVTRVTYPFFSRLDVFSAYEYLEQRFGLEVRLLGAGIFVLWRVCWMGIALYVPCLIVHTATGRQASVMPMVIVLGAIVTFYTMCGGIKAVVYTDVLQFCVMFIGLIVILGVVIYSVDGTEYGILGKSLQLGKLRLFADVPYAETSGWWERVTLYLKADITFFGIAAGTVLSRMAAFTSDQVAVQRFQTMDEKSQASKVMLVNIVTDVIRTSILCFVGLSLFVFYQMHSYPDGLNNDQVFPYFMATAFPIGLKGLVIAAIIAASLASVDAALNSTTSVLMVDFYGRAWKGRLRPSRESQETDLSELRITRLVNMALGVCVICIALNIERMGELYVAGNKLLGAFFGTLLGIFLIGMFSRRTGRIGILLAATCGLLVSCTLSFFSNLHFAHSSVAVWTGPATVDLLRNISWQWPPIFGIFTTLFVGFITDLLTPAPKARCEPLTFWEVMRSCDESQSANHMQDDIPQMR